MPLTGGEEKLISKANGFFNQGKPLEALHLLDIVLAANSESVEGRQARHKVLTLLLEQSGGKNLWERMSISAEMRDLED